jgi:hypothetical protein
MAQIVNALSNVDAEQVKPIKPKSEAQLAADRSAAAIVLNSVYLREREARYGKAAPRVIAADVLAEALKESKQIELPPKFPRSPMSRRPPQL